MEPLRFALLGLGVGGLYLLAAQGLVLAHRASGTVNFAQGALGMVGAFAFYGLRDDAGWPTLVALVVALAASGALGAACYGLVLRRLEGTPALTRVIATLAILLLLVGIGAKVWGNGIELVASPLPDSPVDLAGASIAVDRLIVLGLGLAMTAALTLAYGRTRFGFATSALAEDPRGLAALGWSPALLATVNWCAGGALAALAAILLAPIVGLGVLALALLLLPAIAAALLGRFESFVLTAAAALAIGVVQSELARYVSVPGIADAVPFAVVVVVLAASGRVLPPRSAGVERMPALGAGRAPRWAVALALPAVVGTVALPAGWADAVTTSASLGIVCLSVVVVTGLAGQVSLGQLTIAGMGGWLAAQLVAHDIVGFWPALAAAVAGAAVLGLALAGVAARVRGVTLAIATLGVSVVLASLVLGSASLTGGFEGLRLGGLTLFGVDLDAIAHPERYAALCVAALAACTALAAGVRRGSLGHRLVAVRSNERAAAAIGRSVVAAKVQAFALGAAIAAIGGVLLTFRTTTADFSQFSLLASITLVLYVVVSGVGFVASGIVAGLLVPGGVGDHVLGELLGIEASEWLAIASAATVLALVVRDRGDGVLQHAVGVVERLRRRVRGGPTAGAPVVAGASSNGTPPSLQVRAGRGGGALELSRVVVRFGGVTALDGVDLRVEPGEVVGLLGPNGAGKTTLIDAALGYVPLAAGAVALGAERLDSLPPHRRARLGVVRTFQNLELFEDLTVAENLAAAAADQHTAAAAASLLRLEDCAGKEAGALDQNRRRLLALGRALAAAPALLLLDEPAAGLDEAERRRLAGLVRSFASDHGIAVLLVEHDVGLVLSVSDRVYVLDRGRMIASGSPETIRDDAAVIAAYLGPERRDHASTP